MATKGAGKGRGRSGGLRFSEDEFLAMQQRVRGSTVTAEGGGLDKAISLAIHKPKTDQPNVQPVGATSDPLNLTPKPEQVKKTPAKRKPKAEAPVLDKTAEDPDWTAPRTVKVKKTKGGKSVNTHVKDVIDSIKYSTVLTSTSSEHLALVFDGARLLTLNEILALMPYQPYLVFNYKTAWKNKIDEALLLAKDAHKARMPEFSDSCLFIGFRRSTRLVDRDGLPACFKYILDDLRNQFVLPERILKDDNPNLIVDTPCFQTQGPHMVGIRLERVASWTEPVINDSVLLTPHGIVQDLGFVR